MLRENPANQVFIYASGWPDLIYRRNGSFMMGRYLVAPGRSEKTRDRNDPRSRLYPAQLLHRDSGVPNFRHVLDLVAVKLHHVYIVGLHALAGWWTGPALTGMRRVEDTVCADAFSLFVGAE